MDQTQNLGGVWSPSPSSAAAPLQPAAGTLAVDEVPVRVGCRLRPGDDHDYCLRVRGAGTVAVLPSLRVEPPNSGISSIDGADGSSSSSGVGLGAILVNTAESVHSLDHAFPPTATQYDVFKATVQPLAHAVVARGGNATVLACGPAGGGKTFTMMGSGNNPGLMPRAISEVFRLSFADANTLNSNSAAVTSAVGGPMGGGGGGMKSAAEQSNRAGRREVRKKTTNNL